MFGASPFSNVSFADTGEDYIAIVVVTGTEATASLGTVTPITDVNVSTTGVSATSAVGNATAFAEFIAEVTGLNADSGLGSVLSSGGGP